MGPYYYDLHLHTCLSPCADEEMTPPSVAGFAALAGLQIIAVCDHNTAGNARAVMEAAAVLAPELLVIPGMEVTCREEAHILCLFPDIEAAEAASEEVYRRLPPIRNREEIYGAQLKMDAEERILKREERLLITAADLSVDELPAFAARYGGFAVPAHIDRESESVLAVLGTVPEGFPTVEVADPERFLAHSENEGFPERYHIITGSDAHCLAGIPDRRYCLSLPEKSFPALKAALTKPKR